MWKDDSLNNTLAERVFKKATVSILNFSPKFFVSWGKTIAQTCFNIYCNQTFSIYWIHKYDDDNDIYNEKGKNKFKAYWFIVCDLAPWGNIKEFWKMRQYPKFLTGFYNGGLLENNLFQTLQNNKQNSHRPPL